ncbi:unnamed protein product [Paramecium pentaurelia]|uniref:Uncharacterized protein n=1 Tax=Paramecium pentaurelia TaxID=43138 RepID=A0A8S1WES2_9CILI|nr:unnamed protein product [Paramecium pentaurelia]
METTNINDLSELIKEKEKVYTFRMLEKKDAYELMVLMSDAFVYYNDAFKILESIDSDMNNDACLQEYVLMVEKNLSFGAFHGEKLVSACLSYDLSSKSDMHVDDGKEPSQAMKEIGKMIKTLLDVYSDTKSLPKNEISYLSHLATRADYCQQNLAIICSYLSAVESRKQGFKKMLTGAGHIGTFKAFTKIFKKYEKVTEIKEVREQPIFMVSLIAALAP